MKKQILIEKFIKKLDFSYTYKTKNERQNIINELYEIAGIEQLDLPVVGISLEPKEQKILVLLLLRYLKDLENNVALEKHVLEEYKTYYHKLIDKINEA